MDSETTTGQPKPSSEHIEDAKDRHESGAAPEIKEDGLNQDLPKSYFMTAPFLGTLLAAGFGFVGGTGAFAFVASIIGVINTDIGPDPDYIWIGLVNTLMLAIGFTLVGRLSDIFGRRWFVICGNATAVVGCIICSQAKTIQTLIAGNVFIGLAASVQTSVPFVIGELVPMKYRYLVGGAMYVWAVPPAAFGPAVAYAFVSHTSAGWRWLYYLMLITNVLSTLCWFLFYHPPTFHMLSQKSRLRQLKEIDYIGLVLFTGGLLLFLLGLSWGGSVHPWKSGHVIGAVVAGGVALISFVLYEVYIPLEQPLVPMHLFRNIPWVINIALVATAASVYYGFSIIFPQMVFGIYTSDPGYGSLLCCAVTASFMLGVMTAGLSRHIGKQKWQMVVCTVIFTPLLAGIASATVDNKNTVLGLLITGCIFVGYVEGVGVTSTGITIHDQAEIGAAVGIGSTFRAAFATIATTVYVVILNNRIPTTVAQEVVPALANTNLPATSYASFIAAISTGSFEGIPGLDDSIIQVGVEAYKQALVLAFRTLFLTTLAFSGLTLICAIFFPNLDSKMTNEVARALHKGHTLQRVAKPKKQSDSTFPEYPAV